VGMSEEGCGEGDKGHACGLYEEGVSRRDGGVRAC